MSVENPVAPSHSLFSLMSGNTSLYVIAFVFPIIRHCLSASTIHPRNSRKREKGGLVTMISASLRRAVTSGLRKSPSPSRYCHSISWKSITPSPLRSWSSMKILPRTDVLAGSNCGASCSKSDGCHTVLYFLLSGAYEVEINFFKPRV